MRPRERVRAEIKQIVEEVEDMEMGGMVDVRGGGGGEGGGQRRVHCDRGWDDGGLALIGLGAIGAKCARGFQVATSRCKMSLQKPFQHASWHHG